MSKEFGEGAGGNEILAEMREQTKWLKFLGLRALGPVLEQQLKSDRERLAYELSDGRSSEAIAPLVGVTARSILNWWAKWMSAGIATEVGRGRPQRLVSLTQVGMTVPVVQPMPKGSKAASTTNGSQEDGNAESASA